MAGGNDVERTKEFYSTFGKGYESWDDAKLAFEGFYDVNVKYDVGQVGDDGNPSYLGFDDLMGFARKAIEGKAHFKVDKIEETEDGIFSSGWMYLPGVLPEDGKFTQSVSKLENGKFVFIKHISSKSDGGKVEEAPAKIVMDN